MEERGRQGMESGEGIPDEGSGGTRGREEVRGN
jgi:hypothetical protein